MKQYKGFILESGSSEYEEKEWSGGHTSEGTGRYYTTYWTKTFNPKTNNTEYFSSEEEAKNAIDMRKQNIRRNKSLKAKMDKLKNKEKKLEEKRRESEREFRILSNELSQSISELYKQIMKVP